MIDIRGVSMVSFYHPLHWLYKSLTKLVTKQSWKLCFSDHCTEQAPRNAGSVSALWRNLYYKYHLYRNFHHPLWSKEARHAKWYFHDDVIKRKSFPRYLPFVRGINGWVNNGKAGDLRRPRAHYDVIVMIRRRLVGSWYSNLYFALFLYPPHNEVVGGILVSIRPSVRPPLRPSVPHAVSAL